jgi:hypothetical protein
VYFSDHYLERVRPDAGNSFSTLDFEEGVRQTQTHMVYQRDIEWNSKRLFVQPRSRSARLCGTLYVCICVRAHVCAHVRAGVKEGVALSSLHGEVWTDAQYQLSACNICISPGTDEIRGSASGKLIHWMIIDNLQFEGGAFVRAKTSIHMNGP